ncbi:MAG: hypothetical protein BRD52_05500 [Bacteroidetes bacterium SW_4_67_19]|nr:MAG: hypothetical protein BRD52_05500 [Bacteroidetes bacterium SW_4_67_19]
MPADAASEDAASETDAPERPPAQAPPADDNGNASSRDASADEPLAGEHASARRRSPVEEADEQAEAWARLPFRLRKSVRTLTLACTGLLALAVFYTLYFASSLFLPIVIAVVLNMLFRPLVRGLRQRAGLPDPVGAAVVILVVLGIFAFGLYEVSGPASQWVEQAPRYLRSAEAELRGLFESLESVTKGAEAVGKLGDKGAEAASWSAQRWSSFCSTSCWRPATSFCASSCAWSRSFARSAWPSRSPAAPKATSRPTWRPTRSSTPSSAPSSARFSTCWGCPIPPSGA